MDSNHWTRRSGFTVRRNCRYAMPPVKLTVSRYFKGALLYLEPPVGIEPTTYWLQVSCSTSWAMVAFKVKNINLWSLSQKDCKNSINSRIDKPSLKFLHIIFRVHSPNTQPPRPHEIAFHPSKILLYLCSSCKNEQKSYSRYCYLPSPSSSFFGVISTKPPPYPTISLP